MCPFDFLCPVRLTVGRLDHQVLMLLKGPPGWPYGYLSPVSITERCIKTRHRARRHQKKKGNELEEVINLGNNLLEWVRADM